MVPRAVGKWPNDLPRVVDAARFRKGCAGHIDLGEAEDIGPSRSGHDCQGEHGQATYSSSCHIVSCLVIAIAAQLRQCVTYYMPGGFPGARGQVRILRISKSKGEFRDTGVRLKSR